MVVCGGFVGGYVVVILVGYRCIVVCVVYVFGYG